MLVCISATALAALLTGAVRGLALSKGLLDVPNARSSHRTVTPRGGGVAIVISSLSAFCVLWALHAVDFHLLAALCGGGLVVAGVGLIDDHRSVPAGVRLAVHFAAAVWAVWWLAGMPESRLAWNSSLSCIAFQVLAVLGIVWILNLYNFMDGIDGIAASEAIFFSWGAALLLALTGGASGLAAMALALGAASLGFLIWNWPPATIFMGDVGSGYLGYVIGVLALAGVRASAVPFCAWLVLGGVFFVDATLTLVRRMLRGERVHQAHRSHAYQWLARRWHSHKRVTVAVLIVNIFWLFPCAGFAVANPRLAAWAALFALGPLAIAAFVAGAGRPEAV